MHIEGFAERIDFAIKKLGGTGKAATLADVSQPTFSRWKDGSSDPKMSNLSALARAANVSLDWLVYGEGDENSIQFEKSESFSEDYVLIPAYDIEVSAGHGIFTSGAIKPSRHLAFRKRWIKARGLDAKMLAVVFTKGDSMEPTIREGAAIVVDTSRTSPLDGKIYVIRIEDRLWVKRVQWIPSGGLRLISDNKHYDSFDISRDDLENQDVEICGQLIHVSFDLE